ARGSGRRGRRGGGAGSPQGPPPAAELPGPHAFAPEASEVLMSRDELLAAAGLEPEQLSQLEQFGLISRRGKTPQYDGDALAIATAVAELAQFGIEARHLRAYRSAADREIGLFEQVVSPLVRQKNPQARARADEGVR